MTGRQEKKEGEERMNSPGKDEIEVWKPLTTHLTFNFSF